MKHIKIILAAALFLSPLTVQAADPSSKVNVSANSVANTSAYNWTGVYIGANIGSGRMNTDQFGPDQYQGSTAIDAINIDSGTATDLIGGFQAGYDKQFGKYVLGVQAMLDLSNIDTPTQYPDFPDEHLNSTLKSVGTLTGRVGYLYEPELLLYAKGGLAFAKVKHTDNYQVDVDPFYGESTNTQSGFTIGAGFEYELNAHMSILAEYNHLDFGKKTTSLNYTGTGIWWDSTSWKYEYKHHLDSVLVGVNYRF